MSATAPPAATLDDRIETEAHRIRGLVRQREFTAALAAATALLREAPESRDSLYLMAVSQRYLDRTDEALKTLQGLEQLHPAFARLYQERGHCLRVAGVFPAAIEAFQYAVQLDPALLASWQALATLLRSVGLSQQADLAAAEAAQLSRMAPPVLGAWDVFYEGNIGAAERMVRRFLQTHGDDVEGMRLLARIGVQHEVLDDAERLLAGALELAPQHHLARYDLAVVLCLRQKHSQAVVEARKLLSLDPAHRAYRTLYATACAGIGDHDEALGAFRGLLNETPENAELHLSVGHSLKTLGRQQEAIASYRKAAAARPSFGDAYWSLANLKTYRFTDAELDTMQAQEACRDIRLIDRYHLCFALGTGLEDRHAYEQSFRYYERGNSLKKGQGRYDAGIIEREVRRQAAVFTPDFLAARAGLGCDRPGPIFIVGLPRAGSTLIEQILASHSQVEGTMELPNMPRLVHELECRGSSDQEPPYPGVLHELDGQQLRQLGERYLVETQPYRKGRPFFIDKMPNNFRHLGLIHLILPNAKIIDARREPMACCFSVFKQLFATGQEFSYSLEDIARYYRAYVESTAHWDTVIPGKILRVQHEALIEDFEPQVRRILDFLHLAFEPACLEFYKTQRSVRTASSEQVRRPIYKDGLDQWRNFEEWLGPLEHALGDLTVPVRRTA